VCDKARQHQTVSSLNVFLTVHHELTIH